MSHREPTCVWRLTPLVVVALQTRFGDPLDRYVNGSQVWFVDLPEDETPGTADQPIPIEWRLHPVPNYVRPVGVETDDVFPRAVFALANGEEPDPSLHALWEGLEAWPAFGDDVSPESLRRAVRQQLGIEPDAHGMVDHETIGRSWEKSNRAVSIVQLLFEQLG